MPYNYAHALAGMAALTNCKNNDRVGIAEHPDAFFLGTMGPDPYYGDAYPPPVAGAKRTDLADRLHALDGRTLFFTLLALSEGSEARMAYTMGFLCHFLLDNRAHPYIEARFPGKLHTPAEIAMDTMLVARADEPRLLVSPARFYKTDALPELDALHAALFFERYGLRTEGLYRRAVKKWLRLNAFLFDPRGKKYAFARALRLPTQYFIAPRSDDGRDPLNLSHALWLPPWDAARGSTASVPELVEAAGRESGDIIDQFAMGERDAALSRLAGRTADAATYVSE